MRGKRDQGRKDRVAGRCREESIKLNIRRHNINNNAINMYTAKSTPSKRSEPPVSQSHKHDY